MIRFRHLLAAALAAALMLPAAAQAEVPPNADWTETWIPGTPGGDPALHVDILKPKGTPDSVKLPAIVSVGPYFNHSGSTPDGINPTAQGPNDRWKDLIEEGKLFERGYALVLVDLRGFGASEGCNDFGGPGEQADSRRAVEWTASQPWSTGKVGMWGKSYDAWTEVMALDEKPKGLAATVIQAPIIDGYRTLYMRGVHYAAGWYATPALYQSIDAMPPSIFDSPEYFLHSALGTNPACYAANIALQNGMMDHDDAAGFWKERDLPGARGSDVPTLWTHGFMDANTKADNFMDVWTKLTGPRRAWFGQFTHVRGNESDAVGRKGFFEEAFRWLDRYVKGDESVDPFVDPVVEVAEGDGRWRGEASWPPADVVERRMALNPGSYTDSPGNDGQGSGAGNGIWSITAPLPYDVHLAGVPTISAGVVTASQRAHLIGLLYDIDPAGRATLIQRGATAINSSTGDSAQLELYPDDWTLRKGHRIGVLLTGADDSWWTPPHSQMPVEVTGGSITLPLLSYQRGDYLEGEITPAIRSRRPFQVPAEALAAPPVAWEMPPALAPRPSAPQGSAPPPPSAQRPANRLKVVVRRAKGKRLKVTVRGVGTSRVRLTVRRGRTAVLKRTVAPRRGVARVTLKLRRRGRYVVAAKLLGGPRLSGRSRAVRVR